MPTESAANRITYTLHTSLLNKHYRKKAKLNVDRNFSNSTFRDTFCRSCLSCNTRIMFHNTKFYLLKPVACDLLFPFDYIQFFLFIPKTIPLFLFFYIIKFHSFSFLCFHTNAFVHSYIQYTEIFYLACMYLNLNSLHLALYETNR